MSVFVVLAIGVCLTVFALQQQQIIRSRAAALGSYETVRQIIASARGSVDGVAVSDRDGNILLSVNGDKQGQSLSVTKAMIAVAFARMAQNTRPDHDFTQTERDRLYRMITQSNNQDATKLYCTNGVGRNGVNQIAHDAGMQHFVLRESSSGCSTTSYILGTSLVTANDQARFFARIDRFIPERHRDFVMQQFKSINGAYGGRWGVYDANLGATALYTKSGWSGFNGGTVNQSAQVIFGSTIYGFAAVTRGEPTEAAGIDLVRRLAQAAFGGQGSNASSSNTSECGSAGCCSVVFSGAHCQYTSNNCPGGYETNYCPRGNDYKCCKAAPVAAPVNNPVSNSDSANQASKPTTTALSIPSLFLHTIGKGGDSILPGAAGGGNTDPDHETRQITINITDTNGSPKISNKIVEVIFDSASGAFKTATPIDLGDLPTGSYKIIIKMDISLPFTIIQALTAGQTTSLPTVSLVTGDINNDSHLNISDWNMLLDCFSDIQGAKSCDGNKKLQTDITDDNKVDHPDVNVFIRECKVNC